MSLGAWIFAAVVLVLVVVNAPFRKWFLRAAGVVAALAVVAGLGWYIYDVHQQHVAEAAAEREHAAHMLLLKRVDDCITRQMKDGNVTDDAIARSICTDNPDAPAGTPAPDWFAQNAPPAATNAAPPPAPKPEPKPEPTNYEVRVQDGSYVKDGRREQGYVEYKCVNTDTGEIMPTSLMISPNWEILDGSYSHLKKFADLDSADAYVKRSITADCKKWVSK